MKDELNKKDEIIRGLTLQLYNSQNNNFNGNVTPFANLAGITNVRHTISPAY